jgi:NAD(P)-dependent dehydrogenase (short-subunit alcohol dehydrogenase family)
MRGIAGKRVLVTAGGAGIGGAIAAAFLSGGARVWICDIDADQGRVSESQR